VECYHGLCKGLQNRVGSAKVRAGIGGSVGTGRHYWIPLLKGIPSDRRALEPPPRLQ